MWYKYTGRRNSINGWIPEWPKGTDCKSAANCFGGSNPPPPISTLQWERAQECVTSILEACLQSACYAFLHRRIRRERENEVFECHAIRKYSVRRCGGIGRRKGLKIPRWQHRAGSSPATCSKLKVRETLIIQGFPYFCLWLNLYASVCKPVNMGFFAILGLAQCRVDKIDSVLSWSNTS